MSEIKIVTGKKNETCPVCSKLIEDEDADYCVSFNIGGGKALALWMCSPTCQMRFALKMREGLERKGLAKPGDDYVYFQQRSRKIKREAP